MGRRILHERRRRIDGACTAKRVFGFRSHRRNQQRWLQSFPLLKCLRIEMETNNSSDINVRDALKLLPLLETLELNTDSTFKGDSPISIHENLKAFGNEHNGD
ncbi:hypothetical protein HA402_011810 [Bradysia odoriphaga]|nr:hypothetical protein HA402_011810 [Bradysia odoriphaga]